MRMSVWLAPQVRAAWVETDVVLLDIASDAYLCLVGAGEHLRQGSDGGLASHPPEAAQDLLDAGLLISEAPAARPGSAPPPSVTRGLESEAAAVNPLTFLGAVVANRRAAKAVADQPFQDVLALAGPLDPAAFETPSPALLAESARFSRMAPWLPHAGLCLMRSLQQRLYLAARGHGVAWVFGVRTWPFEAHCWLQAGAVVLDDTPTRVSGFTPILVV
jgi:hypothetical protein